MDLPRELGTVSREYLTDHTLAEYVQQDIGWTTRAILRAGHRELACRLTFKQLDPSPMKVSRLDRRNDIVRIKISPAVV